MANFGEMAVALQVSRHRLENDIINMRRICARVGVSSMGTELAIEGFEHDVLLVDETIVLLREMSKYENDILDVIARKNSGRPQGLLSRIFDTARAAVL